MGYSHEINYIFIDKKGEEDSSIEFGGTEFEEAFEVAEELQKREESVFIEIAVVDDNGSEVECTDTLKGKSWAKIAPKRQKQLKCRYR